MTVHASVQVEDMSQMWIQLIATLLLLQGERKNGTFCGPVHIGVCFVGLLEKE